MIAEGSALCLSKQNHAGDYPGYGADVGPETEAQCLEIEANGRREVLLRDREGRDQLRQENPRDQSENPPGGRTKAMK